MQKFRSPGYHHIFSIIAAFAFITCAAASKIAPANPPPREIASTDANIIAKYSAVPLQFELNRGQAATADGFIAHAGGFTIALQAAEAVVTIDRRPGIPAQLRTFGELPNPGRSISNSFKHAVVRIRFLGARTQSRLIPDSPQSGRVSYLSGRKTSRWLTAIPTYTRVATLSLWPGVDAFYYGHGGRLEYDFVVHPGASPNTIRMQIGGARQVTLGDHGDLAITTDAGDLELIKPVAYQEVRGFRQIVPVHYRVTPAPAGRGVFRNAKPVDVVLRVGPYDESRRLIIDPVLSYSTYFGGDARDIATGIAVDSTGAVFITGQTTSADFPVTPYATETACPDCSNMNLRYFSAAFVTKLIPAASGSRQLVYSTYIGGTNGWGSAASAIALEPSGDVAITGVTSSTDFPVTADAFQANCPGCANGNPRAFVTVINPDADGPSQITYSTYLGGGAGFSAGEAIAAGKSGTLDIAGYTSASDFPVTAGAPEKTCPGCANGTDDGFVTMLNPSIAGPEQLRYSTFLGGSGNPRNDYDDAATAIASGPGGNIYVAGQTVSADFPVTSDAFQPACPGAMAAGCGAAFVTELDPGLTGAASVVYSTFLGGSSGLQGASGIALDSAGDIFVAGATFSSDFPVTPGALQRVCAGGCARGNAFVSELNPARRPRDQMLYSTYLGGSGGINGGDSASALVLDSSSQIYLTGTTFSADFPVTRGAFQQTCASCTGANPEPSAFVVVIDPHRGGKAALRYGSYLGGSGGLDGVSGDGDWGAGIALGADEFFVTGYAGSADFPTTANAYQPGCAGCANGGGNAFVAGFTGLSIGPPSRDRHQPGMRRHKAWRHRREGRHARPHRGGRSIGILRTVE